MNKPQTSKLLVINTDGGSRSNPGPAGIGYVIRSPEQEVLFERGEYIGTATNNVAEYKALIAALEAARDMKGTDLLIRMDSELIVKQMKGEYKVKEPSLQALHRQVRELLTNFTTYQFEHVLRQFNKDADRMVNQAIDGALGKG